MSGLPSTATNTIARGKDDFTTDFLAITLDGAVAWHNADADTHFLDPVYGWAASINPADLGNHHRHLHHAWSVLLLLFSAYRCQPPVASHSGASGRIGGAHPHGGLRPGYRQLESRDLPQLLWWAYAGEEDA